MTFEEDSNDASKTVSDSAALQRIGISRHGGAWLWQMQGKYLVLKNQR